MWKSNLYKKKNTRQCQQDKFFLPTVCMVERRELGTLYWNSWKQAFKNLYLTSGIFNGASETLVKPVTNLYIECILSAVSWGGL
jgi:hypothetical protein